MHNRTRGGRAGHIGGNYEHRVAAYIAVRVLAGEGAPVLWELTAPPTILRCTTEQLVDDVLVESLLPPRILGQVKHHVVLSEKVDTELSKAVEQVVRHYLESCPREARPGRQDTNDILALITRRSNARVHADLRAALQRVRGLTDGEQLTTRPFPDRQKSALTALRNLVKHWHLQQTGGEPNDETVLSILKRMRVYLLDVDPDEVDEDHALETLRVSVLADPTQDRAAWSTLIDACAQLAASSAGADRTELQRLLRRSGVALRTPPEYDEDIARLKQYSGRTLEYASRNGHFEVGSDTCQIQRPVNSLLYDAVQEGNLLVTGEPGIGKSGAMHEVARRLQREEIDVVYIDAATFAADSGTVTSTVLLPQRPTDEVLIHWEGRGNGVFFVDGLDAVRTETAAGRLRQILSSVVNSKSRWNVVASIRKFDLEHSVDLPELFAGIPIGATDPSLPTIRYLDIQKLSDDELREAGATSLDLEQLLSTGGDTMKDLLRVPFNLRLAGELLASGIPIGQLAPLRTQTQLLARYWRYRVVGDDDHGDNREVVLDRAVDGMIALRSLRVARRTVLANDTSSGEHVQTLLRAGVLSEWRPTPTARPEQRILAFSHHVLFDYAAGRLAFGDADRAIAERFKKEPDLAIFLRPSAVYYLHDLWDQTADHRFFWQGAMVLAASSEVPGLARIIGPTALLDLYTTLDDADYPLTLLKGADQTLSVGAERILQLAIGAVLAVHDRDGLALTADRAQKWWDLFDVVSKQMTPMLAFALSAVLSRIRDATDRLSPDIQSRAGAIARRVISFSNADSVHYRELRTIPLEVVSKLFSSDPSDSEHLLHDALQSSPGSYLWVEDMMAVSRGIDALIEAAPELVQIIYSTVFAASVTEDAPVPVGSSQLLPLTTTTRQNLQLVWYSLANAFPRFLRLAPTAAAHALLTVIDAFDRHKAASVPSDFDFGPVDFRGHYFGIRPDYSVIWDDGQEHGFDDEPIQMLSEFQRYFEGLDDTPEARQAIAEILDLFAANARWAVLWRRLLIAASRGNPFFQQEVSSLASSRAVLRAIDTSPAVGAYLQGAFGNLPVQDRMAIEQAILALPCGGNDGDRHARELIRDRLLGTLQREALVTEQARTRLAQLDSAGGPPENVVNRRVEVSSGSFGEIDHLAAQGVPVDEDANVVLRTLAAPLQEFAEQHVGKSVPQPGEVAAVLPRMKDLFAALGAPTGAHPVQIYTAWNHLVSACEAVADAVRVNYQEDAYLLSRKILLFALDNRPNDPHPDRDLDPAQPVSWSEPNVLLHVARGLTVLSAGSALLDSEILYAVESLSKHENALIRYAVATVLPPLLARHETTGLSILRAMCATEAHPHVVSALLASPIGALRGRHPELVAPLTSLVLELAPEGNAGASVRRLALQLLAVTCVAHGDSTCCDLLDPFLNSPEKYKHEVIGALFEVRRIIQASYSRKNYDSEEFCTWRVRGWSIMLKALEAAQAALKIWRSEHHETAIAALPETEEARLRDLVEVIVDVSDQTYFASGAFDPNDHSPLRLLDDTARARVFLDEAGSVLERLADAPHARAVHHLLETLIFVARADPTRILCWIADILSASQASGYQLEREAERLVIALFDWLLADHRELVASSPACRAALIRLTSVFIDAGWPSMWQVAFDLDALYR